MPVFVNKNLTAVIYRSDMQTEYTCCRCVWFTDVDTGLHEVLLNQILSLFYMTLFYAKKDFILYISK